MGVKGLWTILSPACRIVQLPSLSGQKLAIDASIWILQLLSSRHRRGKTRAYLSGLYLRLGKLLAFGILPLVVFDGATPQLKSHVCGLRSLSKKRREEQYREMLLELLAAKLLTQEGGNGAVEEKEASPQVSVSSSSEEDQSEREEERVELEAASAHFHSFSQFQLRKYCSTQSRPPTEAPGPAPKKLESTSKDPPLSPRRLAALIRLGILETNSGNTHIEPVLSAPAVLPTEQMQVSAENSSSSDSDSELSPVPPPTDFPIHEATSVRKDNRVGTQACEFEVIVKTTFQVAGSIPLRKQLAPLSPLVAAVSLLLDPVSHPVPTPTPIPSLSEHIHSLETQIRLHPLPDDLSKEEIKCEIQELLRILGIPWIESPMEAEAQCAALEQQGKVDGVITEDSDAFLFGAKQVYRGLVSRSLEVESYNAGTILQDLGFTRLKLVAFAQLLGCDYHPGVPGVGPVLATELLQVFPDLVQLRTVVERPETGTDEQRDLVMRRSKALRRVKEVENMPDAEVEKAYFSPIVDQSPAQFHWFPPQIPQLQAFLTQKLTWTEGRSLAFTQPLLNSAAASVFCTLDCYKQEKKKDPPKSKRMRKALKLG